MKLRLLQLALLALVLLGCGKSGELPGTWAMVSPTGERTVTFREEGKFDWLENDKGIVTRVQGDYVLTSESLTLTPRTFEAESDEYSEKDMEQYRKFYQTTMNQSLKGQVQWKDQERFVMAGPNNTVISFIKKKK